MENILLLVSAATTFAKIAADMLNIYVPARPSWMPPLAAILTGFLSLLGMFVADGLVLTQALIAQAALAGFLAGGGAVGVTALHNQAEESRA
jgi:uncharacterized protein involved in cysteine biosynthesis